MRTDRMYRSVSDDLLLSVYTILGKCPVQNFFCRYFLRLRDKFEPCAAADASDGSGTMRKTRKLKSRRKLKDCTENMLNYYKKMLVKCLNDMKMTK